MTTEESLHYDFDTVKFATEDFSDNNILGQGGFGVVYKVNKERTVLLSYVLACYV